MVPLYDRPLWTLHWENKGLKEFHFLKKQNLESEICYAIDLPLKTKQDKTNPITIVLGHFCGFYEVFDHRTYMYVDNRDGFLRKPSGRGWTWQPRAKNMAVSLLRLEERIFSATSWIC